jgi:hypothetical protein
MPSRPLVVRLFPQCPNRERSIAEFACRKYSGRVGRSSAAKQLDENAVRLAVVAHVRHMDTDYDALLGRGLDRYDARQRVQAQISQVLDVPHLIDIARKWNDPDWSSSLDGLEFGPDDDVDLLPVTAWRTLADLRSSESVEPLIDMLCELDDEFDDWSSCELPNVFGKIGQPAIKALVRLAKDADRLDFIRSIAASGLRCVAEYHPETCDRIVAYLTEMMTNAAKDNVEFNTRLLVEVDKPSVRFAPANLKFR